MQAMADIFMTFQKIKSFADQGQHAQRQNIDFHQFDSVDIIFIPLDEAAVFHGSRADRHGFIKPLLSQNKTADML